MRIRVRLPLTLSRKRNLWGYLFISPFLIGFAFFFLYPFIQSMIFSLSKLSIHSSGFDLDPVGLQNYRHSLFVDDQFRRTFAETIVRMVSDVPLILIFSFFIATLLNQRFGGRALVRTVFFLPVILGAGIVLRMEQTDYMAAMLGQPQSQTAALGEQAVRAYLLQLGLPEGVMTYVIAAVDRIPEIVRASGIQILIFLAGLQSIPRALYEAADVEGATGWESFWMITFPLMSPLLVTNVVYTIIDSFSSVHNSLVTYIQDVAFTGSGYGVSTAMSWIYFCLIAVILMVTVGAISRGVFYHE